MVFSFSNNTFKHYLTARHKASLILHCFSVSSVISSSKEFICHTVHLTNTSVFVVCKAKCLHSSAEMALYQSMQRSKVTAGSLSMLSFDWQVYFGFVLIVFFLFSRSCWDCRSQTFITELNCKALQHWNCQEWAFWLNQPERFSSRSYYIWCKTRQYILDMSGKFVQMWYLIQTMLLILVSLANIDTLLHKIAMWISIYLWDDAE